MPLNPGQFKGPLFHGTTHDIDGRDIQPARLRGGEGNWGSAGHSGQESDKHAFATENEGIAWQFGSRAGMIKRAQASLGEGQDPDRVRVHQVAPHPMMQMGVFHAQHPDAMDGYEDLKEWKAPAFRVKNTLDIMPGRQGTFPSLNWNQFRSSPRHYEHDLNHPTDKQIEVGTLNAGRPRALAPEPNPAPPEIDEHQMDLFSGKTAGEHAENDDSALGDYHRNNLFGRL